MPDIYMTVYTLYVRLPSSYGDWLLHSLPNDPLNIIH